RTSACRNAYVTIVHGRSRMKAGTRTSRFTSRASAGTWYPTIITTNIATLAINRRRAQGVTRELLHRSVDTPLHRPEQYSSGCGKVLHGTSTAAPVKRPALRSASAVFA